MNAFSKLKYVVAAGVLAVATSSANAGTFENGIGFNGIGFNGIGFNGIGFNGIGFNGIGFNGLATVAAGSQLEQLASQPLL